MKILFFANTDWYLYNFRLPLARALREQGHQVVLLSPPGRHSVLLQEAGFEWCAFDLQRKGTNPLTELRAIARLARLFREIHPHVIHLFTIKPVLYGSIAARWSGVRHVICAITGLGHVFTSHNPLLLGLVKLLYRFSLRGRVVVFQNPDDRDLFLSQSLARIEQTRLIPGSGVDTAHFSPRPLSLENPIILLPGRLLRSKGVAEFVGAARRLKQKHPAARFALVGDTDFGNPESVTAPELDAWQKEGIVEWWGWRENMADVLAQASIVCLPSYREGLSRTLLEAAASARPIVATDVPGCRDIVRTGVNGLLAPARDTEALARALDEILSHPETWQTLGQRGREIVEAEYSLPKIIAQTLQIYADFG